MNEFTENVCLPNESYSHSKLRKNALTLTLKGFHCLRNGAVHKNTLSFAQVALAMRFKKKKTHCQKSEFHGKFDLKNQYRTHGFVIHAISVFHVKFTVEFTC